MDLVWILINGEVGGAGDRSIWLMETQGDSGCVQTCLSARRCFGEPSFPFADDARGENHAHIVCPWSLLVESLRPVLWTCCGKSTCLAHVCMFPKDPFHLGRL